MEIKANAKINLSLDVTKKRDDGYHEVEMIMQSISLCDVINIEKSDKITLSCSNEFLPVDESNLAFKAAKLFFEETKISGGAKIHIEKNIPVGAGLAGGSTDASAVLKGLNELYNTGLSEKELTDIGLKLGADVPYCIMGGTAFAQGIGEKLTRLDSLKDIIICLAKPDYSVSTKKIYNKLDNIILKNHPKTKKLLIAVKNKDIDFIADNLVNVLENVTVKAHKDISKIKNTMLKCGACGALMSGSGPTVFGIFKDINNAEKAKDKLKSLCSFAIVTKTE